jgi:hypothetical protein
MDHPKKRPGMGWIGASLLRQRHPYAAPETSLPPARFIFTSLRNPFPSTPRPFPAISRGLGQKSRKLQPAPPLARSPPAPSPSTPLLHALTCSPPSFLTFQAIARGQGQEARKLQAAVLLGIAFGSAAGGLGTLIGTPPNGVLAGQPILHGEVQVRRGVCRSCEWR